MDSMSKPKPKAQDMPAIDTGWYITSPSASSVAASVVGMSKRSVCFQPNLLTRGILRDYRPLKSKDFGIHNFEADYRKLPIDVQSLVWTLKEVGTRAWLSKTRYAFVLTPETCTVLRFFLIKESMLPECTVLGFDYNYFPYSEHGKYEMTMNKAIWALTMMARNKRHLKIVPENDFEDEINTWYDCEINSNNYRIHHISETVKEPHELEGETQVMFLEDADDDVQLRMRPLVQHWVEKKEQAIALANRAKRGSRKRRRYERAVDVTKFCVKLRKMSEGTAEYVLQEYQRYLSDEEGQERRGSEEQGGKENSSSATSSHKSDKEVQEESLVLHKW